MMEDTLNSNILYKEKEVGYELYSEEKSLKEKLINIEKY